MRLSSLNGKGLLLLAAAAAATLAPIRFTAANETYVVVAGDTACEIAEQYSIPCAVLIETNRLGKDALIFVGQRLVLPRIGQASGIQVDEPPAEPETIPPAQVDEPLELENERAEELCQSHNLLGIGGSDAHLTSHIATCMTDFKAAIKNEHNLVDALLSKEFQPVWLKNVVNGAF